MYFDKIINFEIFLLLIHETITASYKQITNNKIFEKKTFKYQQWVSELQTNDQHCKK